MKPGTPLRYIVEAAIVVLIVILFIDNIQFHSMINEKVIDFNREITYQKNQIQDLKHYNNDLNIEQGIQKRDIAKLDYIEEKVEEIDNKIEGLVCILKVDKNGKILECAGSTRELLGFEVKELVGQDIALFMSDEIREQHVKILTSSFTNDLICDRPVTLFGKDKEKIVASLSVISAGEDYIVTLKRT